jgi:hypothetical protein
MVSDCSSKNLIKYKHVLTTSQKVVRVRHNRNPTSGWSWGMPRKPWELSYAIFRQTHILHAAQIPQNNTAKWCLITLICSINQDLSALMPPKCTSSPTHHLPMVAPVAIGHFWYIGRQGWWRSHSELCEGPVEARQVLIFHAAVLLGRWALPGARRPQRLRVSTRKN